MSRGCNQRPGKSTEIQTCLCAELFLPIFDELLQYAPNLRAAFVHLWMNLNLQKSSELWCIRIGYRYGSSVVHTVSPLYGVRPIFSWELGR